MATILLVNDRTYAMTARVDWLRCNGYVVLVAGSAYSVLEALLTNPVDATVLDCHMPEAGVIAPMLKRIRPDLPLVILASFCAVPCPLQGLWSVCVGKRESPAGLLETLRTVLVPGKGDQEAA